MVYQTNLCLTASQRSQEDLDFGDGVRSGSFQISQRFFKVNIRSVGSTLWNNSQNSNAFVAALLVSLQPISRPDEMPVRDRQCLCFSQVHKLRIDVLFIRLDTLCGVRDHAMGPLEDLQRPILTTTQPFRVTYLYRNFTDFVNRLFRLDLVDVNAV